MKYTNFKESIRGLHRVRGGTYADSSNVNDCPKGIVKCTYVLAETLNDYETLLQMSSAFNMKIKVYALPGWDKSYYGLRTIAPSRYLAKVSDERENLSYDSGEETR